MTPSFPGILCVLLLCPLFFFRAVPITWEPGTGWLTLRMYIYNPLVAWQKIKNPSCQEKARNVTGQGYKTLFVACEQAHLVSYSHEYLGSGAAICETFPLAKFLPIACKLLLPTCICWQTSECNVLGWWISFMFVHTTWILYTIFIRILNSGTKAIRLLGLQWPIFILRDIPYSPILVGEGWVLGCRDGWLVRL